MRILACLLILPLCGCLNTQLGKYAHDHERHSASAQLIQKDNQYILEVSALRLAKKCNSFSECDAFPSEIPSEMFEVSSGVSYSLSQRVDTDLLSAPAIGFDKVGPITGYMLSQDETSGVIVKGDVEEVDGQMQVVNCSFKIMEPGNKTLGFQNQTIVVGERKIIPIVEISNDQ